MLKEDDPDNVVFVGRKHRIVWAIDANGNLPAKKFYEGKELNKRECRKFWARFEMLADEEVIVNKEIFNRERGEIYALKIFKKRIYCFKDGNDWVLTNGCKKNQQKADPKELDRAERIRAEHLARKT